METKQLGKILVLKLSSPKSIFYFLEIHLIGLLRLLFLILKLLSPFLQQGIIALTYAKVILTKLDSVQNSSSFVLYILENWNKSLRNIRNSPKKCLTLMQRHGLRRDLISGPNNPTIVASIHTDCATKLPIVATIQLVASWHNRCVLKRQS